MTTQMKNLELLKGGKEKNGEQLKKWIGDASSSNSTNDNTNEKLDSNENNNLAKNDSISDEDVIDLRPQLTSSDSEDGSAIFKKRKHSHSRKYRKNNADDDNDEEEENVGPAPSDEVAGTSGPPPLVDASNSSSDEEFETPRSRVKARRIVRAADLVSSGTNSNEDEENDDDYNDNNSSSTEEDGGTNDVDITEQTKAVVFKDISKPKHNIINDLTNLQFGLRMTPSFSQRRCSSVEMVKRLKLAYKLSGHEGCVNSLHFNQSR